MTLPPPLLPTVALNTTRDLAAALRQLLANLASLQWQGEPAFGRVELFTTNDVEEAFRQLIISTSRACLVFFSGDDFDDAVQGMDLRGGCESEITLVFVSTVIANTQAALLGDDRQPGLFTLRNLVLPAVTGLLVPRELYLKKVSGAPVVLRREGKGNELSTSRVAYSLTLRLVGGEIQTSVGPYPIR